MELTLETPVRYIPHIGPVMADRLINLEIYTVQDLLYHVPFRYDDFSVVSKIAGVRPGDIITINARVETFKNIFTKTGKRLQEAKVSDDSGRVTVIWFNQTYLAKLLIPGTRVHLSGKIDWFGSKVVMVSPQYEIMSGEGNVSLHTGRLVPVYPETAGVSSKWLRGRIAYLLETILPALQDFLPDQIIRDHRLMDLQTALRSVHFPENREDIERGRHRIAFDEVFLLQLRSYAQKRAWQATQHAKALSIDEIKLAAFIASLPFTLTDDQQTSAREIISDLQHTVPMNRLLEGDVGSGKTVIAAIAMYMAHLNSLQSILMAPTVILAQQHFETISALLAPYRIKVGLVTGDVREKGDILIGTHALLTRQNLFKNAGLVVVDEQHRFGVEQRAVLMGDKKALPAGRQVTPHFLTMTATPIPRTMAKTILGSIDISVLRQMPKGRQVVKTWVVPPAKRAGAYEWMASQMTDTGGQIFVICPLIEASETLLDVKAVKEEVERIKKRFPRVHVGLLHGRMKAGEKTKVLSEFRAKKIMILVATPVVEVGIDIPNASIMVVEAADRFGLGQLHQLRGRVGRGTLQSYCLLFTEALEDKTIERLKSLETIHNGPELAEVDLRLRGPGEVFGTRQHGMPHLKIAKFTDMATVNETQRALRELTETDPDLLSFPLLREMTKKDIITEVSKD